MFVSIKFLQLQKRFPNKNFKISVKASCNQITSQRVSYFENPHFPYAYEMPMLCTLTVVFPRNVRQILLDFVFFELQPPTNGDCLVDQFVVTGQGINANVPILCGINTGQHGRKTEFLL